MRLRLNILLLCLLLLPEGWAQQHSFRMVSYNVENLFDCTDDSLKADDEYLPEGYRRWTPKRYRHKLNEIAKTLLALGHEDEAPVLVGLYEVENEQVMEALTRQTPLRSVRYRYLMTSSDDVRGIDIALLYRPDCFRLLSSQSIRANLPGQRPTRDILHVSGTFFAATRDTLDLFLLHLPSRMSGTHETEPYRCHITQSVRQAIDSLYLVRQHPCILLMGDFNEGPEGKALAEVLQVQPLPQNSEPTDTALYNLLAKRSPSSFRAIKGSYKYRGHWELIDHLLASGTLLQAKANHLHLLPETAEVAPLPFLLTDDRLYGGQCPLRTYYGVNYLGGPSDHLPLVVEIISL